MRYPCAMEHARARYESGELIIGLFGPVGTDLGKVEKALGEALDSRAYDWIAHRLSAWFESGAPFPPLDRSSEFVRIKSAMAAGDQIRAQSKRADIMAIHAMAEAVIGRDPMTTATSRWGMTPTRRSSVGWSIRFWLRSATAKIGGALTSVNGSLSCSLRRECWTSRSSVALYMRRWTRSWRVRVLGSLRTARSCTARPSLATIARNTWSPQESGKFGSSSPTPRVAPSSCTRTRSPMTKSLKR